jgi:hypothetical protein
LIKYRNNLLCTLGPKVPTFESWRPAPIFGRCRGVGGKDTTWLRDGQSRHRTIRRLPVGATPKVPLRTPAVARDKGTLRHLGALCRAKRLSIIFHFFRVKYCVLKADPRPPETSCQRHRCVAPGLGHGPQTRTGAWPSWREPPAANKATQRSDGVSWLGLDAGH